VVRELVSAKDGRKTLSVSTRTVYILSARTNPCYSTTHCSALSTVFNVMSLSNYIADSYHVLYASCSSARVLNLIFILARTAHQFKFLRMFPSHYYLPYTVVCTYGTRQVLNLSRFVVPYCIYLC